MEIKCVGDYELLEVIASTNHSTLYKAKRIQADTKQGGLLYVIKEMQIDKTYSQLLKKEEEFTQMLENSSERCMVIPVFSCIKTDEKEYIVMQFKGTGKFVGELIRECEKSGKSLSLTEKFMILREILVSLQELHSFVQKEKGICGILHLDLHPDNIFMENINIQKGEFGTAKFIDFQNSQELGEDGKTLKKNSVTCLTEGYSAPELYGDYPHPNAACDTFSVTAIAARMLTGRNIDAMFTQDIKLPSGYNPVIAYIVENFLKCGLEYNPNYRYKSADAMLKDMDIILDCLKAYAVLDYYSFYSRAYDMLVPVELVRTDEIVFDGRGFYEAVQRLEKSLLVSNIDVNRCVFIYEALWKIHDKHADIIPEKCHNSLVSSGIACMNHIGNSRCAWELSEKLTEKDNSMSLMEYLGAVNRMAVSYQDSYQYERAYGMISRNIEALERIKETYRQVAGELKLGSGKTTRIVELARAYSSRGCLGALVHKGNPMKDFKRALEEFDDDTGNRMITICHILHYAVQTGNEEIYRRYAREYLGDYDSLTDCLDSMIGENGRGSLFALYVFLKGVNAFYIESVNEEFECYIREILEKDRLKEEKSYPVQMVYKYLALIWYKRQGMIDDLAYAAFVKALSCEGAGQIDLGKDLNILMCITYQTMWEYNSLAGLDEENAELIELLKEHSRKSGWMELAQELENRTSMDGLFEFEYC